MIFPMRGSRVLWVLSLHILTLSVWTASAIYVPLLLLNQSRLQSSRHTTDAVFNHTPRGIDSMARFVFTHIATPIAIISITAGTVVFLINQSHHFWLLAKLTLVTFLCIVQALLGLLIIRAERGNYKHMSLFCWLAITAFAVLMISIVWIVLGKPATPAWVESLL